MALLYEVQMAWIPGWLSSCLQLPLTNSPHCSQLQILWHSQSHLWLLSWTFICCRYILCCLPDLSLNVSELKHCVRGCSFLGELISCILYLGKVAFHELSQGLIPGWVVLKCFGSWLHLLLNTCGVELGEMSLEEKIGLGSTVLRSHPRSIHYQYKVFQELTI